MMTKQTIRCYGVSVERQNSVTWAELVGRRNCTGRPGSKTRSVAVVADDVVVAAAAAAVCDAVTTDGGASQSTDGGDGKQLLTDHYKMNWKLDLNNLFVFILLSF